MTGQDTNYSAPQGDPFSDTDYMPWGLFHSRHQPRSLMLVRRDGLHVAIELGHVIGMEALESKTALLTCSSCVYTITGRGMVGLVRDWGLDHVRFVAEFDPKRFQLPPDTRPVISLIMPHTTPDEARRALEG